MKPTRTSVSNASFHAVAYWSFLGEFLVNNYKQALDILKGEPALSIAIAAHGIPSADVFPEWLAAERAYLQALSKEPIQETQEMEYYQRLVNLGDSE